MCRTKFCCVCVCLLFYVSLTTAAFDQQVLDMLKGKLQPQGKKFGPFNVFTFSGDKNDLDTGKGIAKSPFQNLQQSGSDMDILTRMEPPISQAVQFTSFGNPIPESLPTIPTQGKSQFSFGGQNGSPFSRGANSGLPSSIVNPKSSMMNFGLQSRSNVGLSPSSGAVAISSPLLVPGAGQNIMTLGGNPLGMANNPFGMSNNRQNPMGMPNNQQNPMGMSNNQQNPMGMSNNGQMGISNNGQGLLGMSNNQQHPMGISTSIQQNPMGMSNNQQNPMGMSNGQQNPMGMSNGQQNPMGMANNQQNPMGMSNPLVNFGMGTLRAQNPNLGTPLFNPSQRPGMFQFGNSPFNQQSSPLDAMQIAQGATNQPAMSAMPGQFGSYGMAAPPFHAKDLTLAAAQAMSHKTSLTEIMKEANERRKKAMEQQQQQYQQQADQEYLEQAEEQKRLFATQVQQEKDKLQKQQREEFNNQYEQNMKMRQQHDDQQKRLQLEQQQQQQQRQMQEAQERQTDQSEYQRFLREENSGQKQQQSNEASSRKEKAEDDDEFLNFNDPIQNDRSN